MNDIDEVTMFEGRRFTTQLIVESWRDYFKQKFNLNIPETKLDYVQEGGELRNIIEAFSHEFMTALDYINTGVLSQFIYYADGDVLDQIAESMGSTRELATSSLTCALFKYEYVGFRQIKNVFKTFTTSETTSTSMFYSDDPKYDGRRLPVPIESYNNDYSELDDRYLGNSVPLAGDFAIMREITQYYDKDNYPLSKVKENFEILQYHDKGEFPSTGQQNKVYYDYSTDKYYKWAGAYVETDELWHYIYVYSEDIYDETEIYEDDSADGVSIEGKIIHYMNDIYTGTVTKSYGDYFIAVWNKNTSTWNKINFPQNLTIDEGFIISTDPQNEDSEQLEFEVILNSTSTTETDNLDKDCLKTGVTIRDSFLNSCGVDNVFDILLNYNTTSTNWAMRLPVESVGTGTEYNIKKNTLVNFDSSQLNFNNSGFDYFTVTNPYDVVNATDDESDEVFKERLLTQRKKCGFGTVRWYDITARDIAGVEDVKIINRPKGDWTAYIIVKPNDSEIVKSVKCFFSNPCNNLLGVNVGVEGTEYKVIDKILVPFNVNTNNVSSNVTEEELWNDTAEKIRDYFANLKIGQNLNVSDINNAIDTYAGVSLELDNISGFYYYENGEDEMKNSPSISVCDTCTIFINPEDIYFTMAEFNPEYNTVIPEEEGVISG